MDDYHQHAGATPPRAYDPIGQGWPDGVPLKSRNGRKKGGTAPRVVRRLYRLQRGICFYCEHSVAVEDSTADHFIPRSKGGSNSIRNKVMACRACNHAKADLMPGEFFKIIGKPVRRPPLEDFP